MAKFLRQLKKQLLTLFEDLIYVITLALFIENSEISMCLLPGLVSWSWIRGQEGDPAADPPQLYAAPAIALWGRCNGKMVLGIFNFKEESWPFRGKMSLSLSNFIEFC